MSEGVFRKLRSQWLDKNDEQPANEFSTSDEGGTNEEAETEQNKWETILGSTSRELSPDGLRSVPQYKIDKRCDSNEKESHDSSGQPKSEESCISRCSSGTDQLCPLFVNKSSPSRELHRFQVGSGRFVADKALLTIRILLLCALGISAGSSFSMRSTISISMLITELFPWLHFAFILCYPVLVVFSLKVCHSSLKSQETQDLAAAKLTWNIVGTVSHLVGTFSVTELVRLLTLNGVPSLRSNVTVENSTMYSLGSAFAVQRYIMTVVAVLELIFSRAPQRLYNVFLVFLASVFWEGAMSHFRFVGKSAAERGSLVAGSIAVAVGVSALFIYIDHMLAICTSRFSDESTADQTVDDIC